MAAQGINARSSERIVEIPAGTRRVNGVLRIPEEPRGIVAFAHGSGSGRFSPRNQFVAGVLHDGGLGTLLVDLLEEDEAKDRRNVFDIELLSDRLVATAEWLGQDPDTRSLRLGYFGASTGAAAALVAAAHRPRSLGAIVSRGGRPDLARHILRVVVVPTLLIVGGHDADVIELNRQAFALLRCSKELVAIPGATHLFPEPGALEEVARLALAWFLRHLSTDKRVREDLSRTNTTGSIPTSSANC
jgi:putative phosphoribosyl transferase